jgi:serine/threonine protein kinase
MDEVTRLARCSRCAAPLEASVSAAGLCPACAAGSPEAPTYASASQASAGPAPADAPTVAGVARSTSEHPTFLAPAGGSRGREVQGPRPTPGAEFGPYRVHRPLGSGGMGDVYEAEHRGHGRRVALKVLGQRLASPDDRARFLREGELAASITHPNTVYVYGSEEIDGAPVIAMELLSGGTLRDLVQQGGPLPPQPAVDLTLQVIDGLEAAQAAGILHRDVKPANCFLDRDGGVKVGDFGLSIATTGRESGASGMFQGTPQFAPPEQIQGEALDVRADIYAVGATLFYLLTGEPPFDDRDLTTLITRVKMEPPRSPRAMRAGVPPGLSAAVTQCLAKDREARPPSYAAVRDLLRAFSSAAPLPAPLGRRLLAGTIDQGVIMALNVLPATFLILQQPSLASSRWKIAIMQVLSTVTYFGTCEGLWGAGVGKGMCGLLVTRVDGQPLRLARGFGRASICVIAPLVTLLVMAIMGAETFGRYTLAHPGVSMLFSAGGLGLQLLVLFSVARRRNGYAAIQDQLTASRVVVRRSDGARVVRARPLEVAHSVGRDRRFGPFDVVTTLGATDAGPLWLARDARLKRQVWVLERPPGTDPVDSTVRDLSRPTRLRWLGGQRTLDEAWDAFEAFDGGPLVGGDGPHPWHTVRRWLADLAVELDHGLADGSLPPLTVGRVWITAAGHARLLDFVAPAAPADDSPTEGATLTTAQAFLARVAARGLSGPSLPDTLPLSARATLDRLAKSAYDSSTALVTQLAALAITPDVVAPWRRTTTVALAAVLPVVLGLLGFAAAFVLRQSRTGADALALDLAHLSELASSSNPAALAEGRALETYIAATYVPTIQNELTWAIGSSARPYRSLAVQVLAEHPTVSADQLAAAKAAIGPFLVEEAKVQQGSDRRAAKAPFVAPLYLFLVGLGLAAALGVAFAVACRGGLLLRSFGIALVTTDGHEVTRVRAGLRAGVAWLPAVVAVFGAWAANIGYSGGLVVTHPMLLALAAAAFGMFLVGAVVAALRTTGGLQDIVVGTRLVPR